MTNRFKYFLFAVLVSSVSPLQAASLSLGADYLLRGVAIKDRDKTRPDNEYYDQKLQAYLVTDLSRDVEATIRVQSITPWGLEGSTPALVTPYPDANGNFFVENAFVRLPRVWRDRVVLTIGRQPIQWGDGAILSDNDLGFNAIRAQVFSPFRRIPFDVEAFIAKISEGLQTGADTDLAGAKLTFDWNRLTWEVMGLQENSDQNQAYETGFGTIPVVASRIERRILGVRARTNLRDAFIRGEYYLQSGDVARVGATDITLGGQAYTIGLGGEANTRRLGRFGAVLELIEGSGDNGSTDGEDEAFRPTFAARWDGLERRGYGHYFAATFSDVYTSTNPFAPVTSVNDGLPAGTSGIQTLHFQIQATPFAKWTLTFDYYQYKARNNLAGSKDLGVEFDYTLEFRYSGLVTFKATTSQFKPGDAFNIDTQQDGRYSSLEAEIRF